MEEFKLKEIKIEVTYKCPLACVHCSSNAHSKNEKEMRVEKCFEIIESASEMGVIEISFSGGEPLCWPGIVEAVKLADDKGISTIIYTSGNVDNIEDVLKRLHKAGLKKAVFSLYSCNEEAHNKITRDINSFKKTINAISFAKNLGITPEVHFVALASNYRIIEDLVNYLASIGVRMHEYITFCSPR